MNARRFIRGLLIIAASVLAVLLLAGLIVAGLLGTQRGSQWLLDRVPGLQVDAFSGRLGAQWQAERLV